MDPTLGGLCLAVLGGDAHAIPVLADRMEDVGPQRFAKHVRRRKRLTADSKVLIVTLALPGVVADRAACGFARHVLPIWEAAFPRETLPRTALDRREAWLRGELDWAEVVALLPEAAWLHWSMHARREPAGLVVPSHAAATAALVAYGLAFDRPSPVANALCSSESVGYHADTVAGWAVAATGADGRAAERAWQAGHLRELIAAACGSAPG